MACGLSVFRLLVFFVCWYLQWGRSNGSFDTGFIVFFNAIIIIDVIHGLVVVPVVEVGFFVIPVARVIVVAVPRIADIVIIAVVVIAVVVVFVVDIAIVVEPVAGVIPFFFVIARGRIP